MQQQNVIHTNKASACSTVPNSTNMSNYYQTKPPSYTTTPPVAVPVAKKATAIDVIASPTFIFYSLLIVSIVITVGAFVLYDKTRKISNSTFIYGTLAPFPNAYPQVLPPASTSTVPDTLEAYCVTLCADETGAMTPCTDEVIQPCSEDIDCVAYCKAPYDLPISCQPPSTTVAKQQSDIGNVSNKYCLVTKQACDAAGDGSDLLKCTSNVDCTVCNDLEDSELEESITCQYVAEGTTLSNITSDGNDTKTFTVSEAGMYCLPKLKLCDSTTGSAVWTAEGWTCRCDKYGDLFGGEDCTELKACSNDLVSGWSSDKQTLLLNQNSAVKRDGYDAIGDPWTVESGVNPLACHDSKNKAVDCDVNGARLNAVCRCDGLAADNYSSFTYDPENPYSCIHDPCSANALAGRTVDAADEAMQLYALMYQFNNSFGTVFGLFEKAVNATTGIYWSIAALVVYPVDGRTVTAVELAQYKDKTGSVSGSIPYSANLRDVRFQWEKGTKPSRGGRLLVFTKYSQNQGKARHFDESSWFYAGVVTADVEFKFGTADTTTSKVLGVAPLQYTNDTGYKGTPLPQTFLEGTTYPQYTDLVGYTLFELGFVNDEGTTSYLVPQTDGAICALPSSKNNLNGTAMLSNTGPAGLFGFVNVAATLTNNTKAKDIGYMYKMYNQEASSCVCSGKDSSLWAYDPFNVSVNNGFTYGGHCATTTIPNSQIVLPAQQNVEGCAIASNTANGKTGLLPGHALDEDGVEYDICAPDPCTGEYTDKYYNVPSDERDGTFNAYTGICRCGDASEGWNHRVFTAGECSDMRTTNPVCSACVNACKLDRGSTSNNQVCPMYWDEKQQCSNICETDTSGVASCACAEGCVTLSSGVCLEPAVGNGCCNNFYPLLDSDDGFNVCSGNQRCRSTQVYDGYDPTNGHVLECHTDSGHTCNINECQDCVTAPVS